MRELTGSMAIRPWMSVRIPLKVLKVVALWDVTVGHALPEQTTGWPTAFSLLQ
jgi:hypothetical protein